LSGSCENFQTNVNNFKQKLLKILISKVASIVSDFKDNMAISENFGV